MEKNGRVERWKGVEEVGHLLLPVTSMHPCLVVMMLLSTPACTDLHDHKRAVN